MHWLKVINDAWQCIHLPFSDKITHEALDQIIEQSIFRSSWQVYSVCIQWSWEKSGGKAALNPSGNYQLVPKNSILKTFSNPKNTPCKRKILHGTMPPQQQEIRESRSILTLMPWQHIPQSCSSLPSPQSSRWLHWKPRSTHRPFLHWNSDGRHVVASKCTIRTQHT